MSDGAEIAFLSQKDADELFKNQPYRVKYELDFLLGGIPDQLTNLESLAFESMADGDFKDQIADTHAFGFELFGDEPFVEEMLEWERNLIDSQGLRRKVQCFIKLWTEVATIKRSRVIDTADAAAVKGEAERLKNELLTVNI